MGDLFGGGGSSGPTPEQRKSTAKEAWSNYGKWEADAHEKFGKDEASTRASMAATGMKAGSQAWNASLQQLNDARDKELSDLKGGANYQTLQQYHADFGDGGDLNEFYTSMFGAAETDSAVKARSASGKATERARAAGAGKANVDPSPWSVTGEVENNPWT